MRRTSPTFWTGWRTDSVRSNCRGNRCGDPETVSLPVNNLQAHVRLIRSDGGPYEPLDEQLGAIMTGLAELLNQFLREAGISEVAINIVNL